MPAISTSALAQLDPHQLGLTMAEHRGLTQAICSISLFFVVLKGIILSVFVPSATAGCPCQGAALGCAWQELPLEAQAARVSKG